MAPDTYVLQGVSSNSKGGRRVGEMKNGLGEEEAFENVKG